MPRPRRIIAFALVILAIGGSYLWSLSRIGPTWYQPPAAPTAEMQVLAERTEYRLLEEFQKLRPSHPTESGPAVADEWIVRLREEQVNAWLAARLPDWIRHEHGVDWPTDLDAPQVRIRPSGIEIAVGVRHPSVGRRVMVIELLPTVEGEHLRLDIRGLSVGRVAVPGHPVERLIEMTAEYSGIADDPVWNEPAVSVWMDVLIGKRPVDRRIKLSDGRRIDVQQFKLESGSLLLRARTLAAR